MEQNLQKSPLAMLEKCVAAAYIFLLPFMQCPLLRAVLGPAAAYVSNGMALLALGVLVWCIASRGVPKMQNSLLKKAAVTSIALTVLSLATSLVLYPVLGELNGENTLRASLPNDVYVLLFVVVFAYNTHALQTLTTRAVERLMTVLMAVMTAVGYLHTAVLLHLPGAARLYDGLNFLGWFKGADTILGYGRITSVTDEPSYFGIALATILYPYMLSRLLLAERGRRGKYLFWVVISLPPLAMTLSSTGYLGVMVDAVAFAALWLHKRYKGKEHTFNKKKLAAGLCAAAAACAVLLNVTPLGYYVGEKISIRNGSLASMIRYSSVLTDLAAFRHFPLTGIGNGNQGYFYNATTLAYAPAEYLDYFEFADRLDGSMGIVSGGPFLPAFLSGYGLIGMALVVWFALACLRAVRRLPKQYETYKYMYYIGGAAFLVLSTAALAIENNYEQLFLLSIPFLGAMTPQPGEGEPKVLLVDESYCAAGEHNGPYRDAIASIPGTAYYDRHARFTPMRANPVKAVRQRLAYFGGIPQAEVICFMHLDSCYAEPFLFGGVKEKCRALVGTLHWFPRDRKRQLLFKWTARYFDAIVVHSEYIRRQCEAIGVKNVRVIDYPVFCAVDLARLTPQDAHGKKVFTCLGGTRKDKGLDILAAALQYLDADTCARIKLVAAGKEDEVPYHLLTEKAAAKGIEVDICPRVLDDTEYWQRIVDTDVILLPYRRMFTGNSGPMTDGIWLNKYILAPDCGNLRFMVEEYHLGSTFEAENAQSLAEAIARVSRADTACDHAYRQKLYVQQFVDSYRELFARL